MQSKEIIDISTGKKIGLIIDAYVNSTGGIDRLVLEERRGGRLLGRGSSEELTVDWNKIVKIGADTILVNNSKSNLQ